MALQSDLDLTHEQLERIQVLVKKRLLALREIRDEAMPRVRAELSGAREEIAAESDSDQEALWRSRFSRLEELLPPLPAPELLRAE